MLKLIHIGDELPQIENIVTINGNNKDFLSSKVGQKKIGVLSNGQNAT